MSSIMKGIVDEGDWTGGIINWKKEVTSKHGPDVTFKKRKLPGVNGKTDTYATNNQGKVVGVYQHHNDMGRVLSETDAIKGADGKRCWKGKRYAGTENGKDKCVPVKEESETKWEVAIEYGPTANHTAKIKVSAPDEDTAQSKALALFKKKFPDRRGMVGGCSQIKEAANPAQQAAIAISKKKKAKTNEGVFDLLKKKPSPRDNMRERLSNMSTDELRQELKDYKSRLSGARASGSLVGAAVSDYVNAIQSELDKRAFNDFTEKNPDWDKGLNEFADDEKSEQPRREHPITIYIYSILHNKTITIVGEKLKRIPYGTYDQVHVEFTVPTSGETRTMWMPVTDKKYPTGALSDNVYLSNSQKSNNTVTDGIFNYWAYEPNMNEGVIVGHDANDPEVAILGGAGTMSLSRLKKKAQGEAEQLANDLARGRFKAAAYNIKQLENTLKTIVAAEDEMSKKYFGENAWNQLGQRKPNTNLPAPERGSRVNHGKRFEEGDIVLPLSGPLKGQPHKVIHSQRTSIRIVPLGRDSYPGDTIAPRTKHEWVVPADTNEDYTGEFAAEKTCETNPYGGQEDRQFRGVISETPTDNPTGTSTEGGWHRTDLDEYREMSPALKAAQQNLIALRNKEKSVNVPGKRERAPRDKVELDKPKPASVLTKGAQEVDPDTMDAIAAFLAKGGEIKKGRPGKAPPTGRQQASKHIGGGGKYRKKSDTPGQGANYRGAAIVAVEEDTAYASGMGQGGNAGESYRTFKPKSAGTCKESSIMKGLNSESK